MNTEILIDKAESMCQRDYYQVLQRQGILPPTRNKDPVNPPWTAVEYEAMEADTAKYFLFYTAILKALKSIKSNNVPSSVSFKNDFKVDCMVVGAGRGRLVDYCVDCLQELNIKGTVHVLEVNQAANTYLKEKFQSVDSVVVYSPLLVRSTEEMLLAMEANECDIRLKELNSQKNISLFVSELFGSFGDNEFVSEIISTCVGMFGNRDAISIPVSYGTYLTVVKSDHLKEYFQKQENSGMFVLGLPTDAELISKIYPVYSNDCKAKCESLTGKANIKLLQNYTMNDACGLAGYFTAKLFDEIILDTRPQQGRNTFFWESAFFPFKAAKPFRVNNKTEGDIVFERTCKKIRSVAEHIFDVKQPLLKMTYEVTLVNKTNNLVATENNIFCYHELYL